MPAVAKAQVDVVLLRRLVAPDIIRRLEHLIALTVEDRENRTLRVDERLVEGLLSILLY